MPRLILLTPFLICALSTASPADDDEPYHELLYPVEARVLDYISRSGDAFVVSTRIATPDDFETALEFYAEKLGRELKTGSNRIRVGGRDPHPLVSVVANDSLGIAPGGPVLNFDKDKPRGIDLVTFVKITPEEQVTLDINRLASEEYTHIVLTHAKSPRGGAGGSDVSVGGTGSTNPAGECIQFSDCHERAGQQRRNGANEGGRQRRHELPPRVAERRPRQAGEQWGPRGGHAPGQGTNGPVPGVMKSSLSGRVSSEYGPATNAHFRDNRAKADYS